MRLYTARRESGDFACDPQMHQSQCPRDESSALRKLRQPGRVTFAEPQIVTPIWLVRFWTFTVESQE